MVEKDFTTPPLISVDNSPARVFSANNRIRTNLSQDVIRPKNENCAQNLEQGICTRNQAKANFNVNALPEMDEKSLINMICKNTTTYFTEELFTKNRKRI